MYGIFDIANPQTEGQRIREFVDASGPFGNQTNLLVASAIRREAKKRAFSLHSKIHESLEDYLAFMESLERRTYTFQFRTGPMTMRYDLSNLSDGIYAWFAKEIDELYKGDEIPQVPGPELVSAVSNFIKESQTMAPAISELTSAVKLLDQEDVHFDDLAKIIGKALKVDDVLVWKCSPLDHHLKLIGCSDESEDFIVSPNRTDGLIGRSIRNKSSTIVSDTRLLEEPIQFQTPETVHSRRWKGFITSPLFSSSVLVGAVGLYKRDFLFLRRSEIISLLYVLSAISKRLHRELTSNAVEENRLLSQMNRLAPQVFIGLKTGYRLHTIKNTSQWQSREVEKIRDLVERKAAADLISESTAESTRKLSRSISAMYLELVACLNISAGKSKQLMASHRWGHVGKSIKSSIDEWTIPQHIHVTYNDEIPNETTLHCDPVAVEHAFRNIFENAIYFLENRSLKNKQAEVTCSLRVEGSTVVIDVCDTAGGFIQEDKAKAFLAFYSGAEKAGTGLGLWMAHRIVVDHGGKISIENVDSGAKVSITLPIRGQ